MELEGGQQIAARAVVLATGAEYRRLDVDDLADYEGMSVFYAAGPPEARRCGAQRVGVVGGGNSAAQAAVWLARGGALVTLLHRRADLGETMSDYLIHELDRYGIAVRDRSEIAHLHGTDGELEAVTLTTGERLPFSFLFLFLGAAPCTDWLGDVVARDANGFVLTGGDRGRRPAGDQRSRGVRRRRRPVGIGEALRDRGRRRRDGRPVRPRAPGGVLRRGLGSAGPVVAWSSPRASGASARRSGTRRRPACASVQPLGDRCAGPTCSCTRRVGRESRQE